MTPSIVVRNVPPGVAEALSAAGVHPVLARVLAARGISGADALDTGLERMLPAKLGLVMPFNIDYAGAGIDQLLEIVRHVGAEIVAARAQLARGQLLVADVIEQKRLHRIDVGAAAAIEFILDDVEQPAMQPLHQSQRFEIERLHRSLARSAFGGFHRRCNGFHHDTSPVVVFIDLFDETCVPPDSHNLRGRFEDPLK